MAVGDTGAGGSGGDRGADVEPPYPDEDSFSELRIEWHDVLLGLGFTRKMYWEAYKQLCSKVESHGR